MIAIEMTISKEDFLNLLSRVSAKKLEIPRGEKSYEFDTIIGATLSQDDPTVRRVYELETVYCIESTLDVSPDPEYRNVHQTVESFLVVDDRKSPGYRVFMSISPRLIDFGVINNQ